MRICICICALGLLGSRFSSVNGLFRLEIAFSPSDLNKLLAPHSPPFLRDLAS